jgi:hypothetical protein
MLALVPNARKKQSNATWVPAEPRGVHIAGFGEHDLAWWKKKVKTWKGEYNRPSLTVRITLWDIAGQRIPLKLSESEFSLEDLKKAKAVAEEHVSAGKGSASVYVHLDVAHTGSGNFDLGNYEPVGPTGFYLWRVTRAGVPVARRGPWVDQDEAKEIGRTGARGSNYDEVLTFGDDPSQQGFEIVRRYRAGSGEVYTTSMAGQNLYLDHYRENSSRIWIDKGYLIVPRVLERGGHEYHLGLEHQVFDETGEPSKLSYRGAGVAQDGRVIIGDPHSTTTLVEGTYARQPTSESEQYYRGFLQGLDDRRQASPDKPSAKAYGNTSRWWDGYNDAWREKRENKAKKQTPNHSGLHSRSQEIREGQRWQSRSTGYVYLVTGVSDTAIEVTPSGPASNHIDADETRIYSFENFTEDFTPMRAVREYAANRRASAPYCSVPVDLFPERDGVRIMADQDRSAIVLNDGLEFVYLMNPLEYEQGDPERRLWILWVKGSRTVRVAWWGQLGSPRDEAMTAVSDWLEQTCFPGLSRGDETQSWGIDFSPGEAPGRWEPIIRAAAFASAKIQKEGTTMSRNSSRALRPNYTPHGYALVRDEDGRILEIERSRDYLERRWGEGRDIVELRRPHKVGDVIAYDHQGHESLAPNGRRIGRERMETEHSKKAELYRAVTSAGLETDHHESDLYVLDTPAARELLRKHGYRAELAGGGLGFKGTDGRRWLDIPFGYMPFWEKKAMKSNASRRYSRLENNPQLFPEKYGVRIYAVTERGGGIGGGEGRKKSERVVLVDQDAREFILVNPLEYDREAKVIAFHFGAYGDLNLLYLYSGRGEGIEDGLEECASWLAEHAPGHIMEQGSEEYMELFNEAKEELINEGEDEEDEELDGKAEEQAMADQTYTESGYIASHEWGVNDIDSGEDLAKAALYASKKLYAAHNDEDEDEDED